MSKLPKLSKTQQELLDAMRAGLVVRKFGGTFYKMDRSMSKCTATANALVEKGLIVRGAAAIGGADYHINPKLLTSNNKGE